MMEGQQKKLDEKKHPIFVEVAAMSSKGHKMALVTLEVKED